MTPIEQLAYLGSRFQGVDLKFRRMGADWPKRWRAECFASAHEGARHVAFGDSAEEAITDLVEKVDAETVHPYPRGESALRVPAGSKFICKIAAGSSLSMYSGKLIVYEPTGECFTLEEDGTVRAIDLDQWPGGAQDPELS